MASDSVLTFGAVVGCLTVIGAGTLLTARAVPRKIQSAVSADLARQGLSDVHVVVDGRAVSLAGPSAVEAKATRLARAVPGVRDASYLPIADKPRSLDVLIAVRRRCLSMNGHVPDRSWYDRLSAATHAAFGTCAPINLDWGDHLEPNLEYLEPATEHLIQTLARDAASADGEISDDEVTLDAEVFSAAGQERIIEAMKAFGKIGRTPTLRVAKSALQDRFADLLGRAGINFATNSAEIDAASTRVLDTAVEVLKGEPTTLIEVGGHADARGDEAANVALSQRRADAVVAYLASKGLDPARFTAVGYGSSRPIAENTTDAGLYANRRIEFVIVSRGA